MEAAMYEMKLESEARQAEKEAAKAAKKGGGATGKKTSSDKLKRLGVTSVRMATRRFPRGASSRTASSATSTRSRSGSRGRTPRASSSSASRTTTRCDKRAQRPRHHLDQGRPQLDRQVQNGPSSSSSTAADLKNNLGHSVGSAAQFRAMLRNAARLCAISETRRPPRQAVKPRLHRHDGRVPRAADGGDPEDPRAPARRHDPPISNGRTASEEDGDDVLFKLLKKHGANFEAIDHGGNKPATLAAKAGRKKSKELLEEALVK